MIYVNNFPRDEGATDMWDSARLAGMMVIADMNPLPLSSYLVDGLPTRHPSVPSSDFSRDQLLPWIAGLYLQQGPTDLTNYEPTNGDVMTPSHNMHLRLCAGKGHTFLGRLFLYVDILFHAYCTPLREPNHIIAQCVVAGPEYVRMWCKHNKQWAKSIRNYWSGWRKEELLAETLIFKIEGYL